jgi:hypothetical protein
VTTISDQIKADQDAALRTIRRVAESLPGYTNGEIGAIMSETALSLVTSDAASDTSRRSYRETCCEPV